MAITKKINYKKINKKVFFLDSNTNLSNAYKLREKKKHVTLAQKPTIVKLVKRCTEYLVLLPAN